MTYVEPVNVNDASFEKFVLESEIPVIVDFWAPWCGPCRMVAPTLEKIAKEYSGKVLVAKVNVDENQQWAGQYGVQSIPTMLFVVKGKIVHSQIGALPENLLRSTLDQVLSISGE
ncbi:MAG: thioredoxin [Anaerolineae bacterium]|nr:thioredoxin [Anaerolineae bacterium]